MNKMKLKLNYCFLVLGNIGKNIQIFLFFKDINIKNYGLEAHCEKAYLPWKYMELE